MRRLLPLGLALATASTSFLLGVAPAMSESPSPQVVSQKSLERAAPKPARKVPTAFALSSSGYGSRLVGGELPTVSDSTAYDRIGCTNLAGNSRRNFEARVTVPGLGVLNGVETRVWTEKKGSTVSSYATHSIARLTLVDTPLGSLDLRGIRSQSRAFNKAGKFQGATQASLAKIVLTPPVGSPQVLDLPTPGQPLVIPGLATIRIGNTTRNVTSVASYVTSNVLDISVVPTRTRVKIAQTNARISSGVKRAVFKGYSYGLTARGLADNVKSGRTPNSIMPCEGTRGKTRALSVARADLGGQVVADGVGSRQNARQTMAVAKGVERGQVARVALLEGRVRVNAIVGQVTVERTSKGLKRSTQGSTVGSIVVDGETYSLPKLGALTIPGVVRIEDALTTKISNGLRVVGLRITVLDGTGAVVDLGVAQLQIRNSGLRR